MKFVESGKRGTVLMSLGTNIKSTMLSKETLTNIIKTFAALPEYNFVWKFEAKTEDLPIKPTKNVLIKNFLPQNDLLAHKNVKAFVTHAGLLSTQEAMWYGKPMVVMPFYCDQHLVADRSVRQEVAVKIDFRTLEVENFKASILEILENEKYSKKIEKLSKAFRDTPKKPLDTAIWWIEYVIRNPDAEHFKTPSLKLGWFVSGSYDIILTLVILFHVSIYAIYKFFRLISRFFLPPETKKLKRT